MSRVGPAGHGAAPALARVVACALLPCGLLAGAGVAGAQPADIVLDGSLSGGRRDVPCDPQPECTTWHITQEEGALSSPNLFFSFERFDVMEGNTASFEPAAGLPAPDVARLIARITGGDLANPGPSRIDGIIRSSFMTVSGQAADLFLLNPRGLLFGPKSRLDLPGSLYLSTADELRFAGAGGPGFVFPTGEPIAHQMLTTAAPQEFGFLVERSESDPGIDLDLADSGSNWVRPGTGTSVTLVGGAVSIHGNAAGAAGNGLLQVGGGTIAIASRLAPGSIPLDVASLEPLGLPPGELGPVSIGDGVRLDVSSVTGTGSGQVVIRAGRFELARGEIEVQARTNSTGKVRAVDIETTNAIDVYAGSQVHAFANSTAAVGDLRLASSEIRIRDAGTAVRSENGGNSRVTGPRIELVGGAVRVLDGAAVLSSAGRLASGGDIWIDARGENASLSVAGGAIGTNSSSLAGHGGNVDITVEGPVSVSRSPGANPAGEGHGRIFAEADRAAGGNVKVRAASIEVDSSPQGEALESTDFASQISTTTEATNDTGVGGNVTLIAPVVRLHDGGQVLAVSRPDPDTANGGNAKGGDIEIFGAEGPAAEKLPAQLVEASGTQTFGTGAGAVVRESGVFANAQTPGATAGGAGSVLVMADQISVTDGAALSAQAAPGSGGDAGGLTLHAGTLSVVGSPTKSSVLSVRSADGTQGGNLEIVADRAEFLSAGTASASTQGSADAGSINVTARDILISGAQSGLFAQVSDVASGSGGDITVNVGEQLALRDGGTISVQQRGNTQGFPGDVTIQGSSDQGRSGSLEVSGGGRIDAEVFSPGAPEPGQDAQADITIRNLDAVSVSGAGSEITAQTSGSGHGGNISFVDVNHVSVSSGASVTAAANSSGAGGDVEFTRVGQLDVSSDATVSAQTSSAGPAGSIHVADTDQVSLAAGGTLSTETSGEGPGGTILIEGVGNLDLDAATVTTATTGAGPGGSIDITTTDAVTLADASRITARSSSGADAGNIRVDAGRELHLKGGSAIETIAATGPAQGGNVQAGASELVLLENSEITTRVEEGNGNGGDIGIPQLPERNVAPQALAAAAATDPPIPALMVLNSSRINANANEGNGGNIQIRAGSLLVSADSSITASSRLGVAGQIDIEAPDAELAGQVTPLSGEFFDASQMMLPPCAARTSRAGSFVIQRRAAPRPPPDAPLPPALASAVQEGQQCTL